MIGRTIFFFWNKTIHSCFVRLESHCHSRREIIQFHLQGKCTSYTKISGFVTRTQGRTELYPTNFRHLSYWKSLKVTVNENFSQTMNENFSCMFPGSLRYFLVTIFETVFDSDTNHFMKIWTLSSTYIFILHILVVPVVIRWEATRVYSFYLSTIVERFCSDGFKLYHVVPLWRVGTVQWKIRYFWHL